MKRGQISVEYITIFGFVFLMIIPLIVIFFDQSASVQDQIAQNQLRNIAIKVTDKAESMYYLGEPSKTTIKVQFPEHIEAVVISDKQIRFDYKTGTGNLIYITQDSKVNLTGTLSPAPGIHYIQIQSSGDEVVISE